MAATIISDVFGRLTWDDELGCWTGTIDWPPGRHTAVAIWHPDTDVVAGLRMACDNLAWLKENDEDALRCVAGVLVDVYNDEWRDDAEPLTEDEFLRRLELVRIAFGEDGSLLLSYDASDLFDGNIVDGLFGPDGSFRGADLVG